MHVYTVVSHVRFFVWHVRGRFRIHTHETTVQSKAPLQRAACGASALRLRITARYYARRGRPVGLSFCITHSQTFPSYLFSDQYTVCGFHIPSILGTRLPFWYVKDRAPAEEEGHAGVFTHNMSVPGFSLLSYSSCVSLTQCSRPLLLLCTLPCFSGGRSGGPVVHPRRHWWHLA